MKDKGSFCWLPGEAGNPERPDPSVLYMHDQRSMSHAERGPDPNTLAYTPHLHAGDLLILKQDLPHKTQDNETARIAFTAKAVGTAYIEDVAWGSLDNLGERLGFYPGRFLYLLNMVGASPPKFAWLHAELAVSALTAFLCRAVPLRRLKRPAALALRYTVMPAVCVRAFSKSAGDETSPLTIVLLSSRAVGALAGCARSSCCSSRPRCKSSGRSCGHCAPRGTSCYAATQCTPPPTPNPASRRHHHARPTLHATPVPRRVAR